MKKVFGFFAVALAFAACNKIDMNLRTDEPAAETTGDITITATLAPKAAVTKAVADNGDDIITVSWTVDEHIAILYEASSTKYKADARIKAVDGTTGAATIEFSVQAGTPDNTDCTLVYPYSAAKDDNSGVKDAATLLTAQDGTLNANLDVRVGAGKILVSTPDLDVTTQPAAQFAIFKFTVRKPDGTTAISTKPLVISTGGQNYTITPTSATDVLYAALPAISAQAVSFNATDSDSKTYLCSKGNVTFTAGKYYQSTLKMHEYVLLGEGYNLKWATCNIGANNPQDYGDYFAWGATAPFYQAGHSQETPLYGSGWLSGKTGYDWASYPFMETGFSDRKHITKYTVADNETDCIWYSGTTFIGDNMTSFTDDAYIDDAARKQWGPSWRTPTRPEFIALLETTNFTWTWTDDYNGTGVKGCIVTSKVSGYVGNHIFLPAAGYRNTVYLQDPSEYGFYWSSSLDSSKSNKAYSVYFNKNGFYSYNYYERNQGFPVRPVAE